MVTGFIFHTVKTTKPPYGDSAIIRGKARAMLIGSYADYHYQRPERPQRAIGSRCAGL
jgi:hypothetical protein